MPRTKKKETDKDNNKEGKYFEVYSSLEKAIKKGTKNIDVIRGASLLIANAITQMDNLTAKDHVKLYSAIAKEIEGFVLLMYDEMKKEKREQENKS